MPARKAAKKRVRGLSCPTCRKVVLRAEPEFPFCSERCRLIDLGKWASNGYAISTPINDPEELLDAEAKEARLQRLNPDGSDGHKRPN